MKISKFQIKNALFRKNESRFLWKNMEKKKIIKMNNMLILLLRLKNGSPKLIKILFLALFGNMT